MKIYMDNCCFNRILDDRSVPIIYYEGNTILIILELIECKAIELFGSQMLIKEIEDTSDVIKKERLKLMYSLCASEIMVSDSILDRAIEIRNTSNIRTKDSIHLACAEFANDKKFKNNANRIPAKIKVMDPNEWLMEVLYGNAD